MCSVWACSALQKLTDWLGETGGSDFHGLVPRSATTFSGRVAETCHVYPCYFHGELLCCCPGRSKLRDQRQIGTQMSF